MTNKKSTKKALLSSVLSLVLCLSMLIGTTFAWFTDSVTSANNIIKSGNLDVELEYSKDMKTWTKVTSNTNVFKENALWEPGYTEVVYLRVSNRGSLALKYQLGVNIVSETEGINKEEDSFKLSDYIEYGVDVEVTEKYDDRATAIAAVEDNSTILSQGYTKDGNLLAKTADDTDYPADVVAMVVYMPETVGNVANHDGKHIPSIELGINVVATQYMSEMDSFNEKYDAGATYPAVSAVNVPEGTTSATKLTVGDVTVYIPAGAEKGQYRLEVTNVSVKTDGTGNTTASYDISLYKDDVKVSGVMYPVEIQVGTLLEIQALTHSGTAIDTYDYDALNGIVSFETDSFSPFAITYKAMAGSNHKIENGKIVGGIFEVNPADIDSSLKEENSEYIAVNYEQDGKTYYVVNERATTVVVSASDTVYAAVNANYTVTNASGKLYSIFVNLSGKEFSTVYILPGTYNEATTLTISSSMDIIGLGDKEDIKIVKVSGSKSNRHLFNCNGAVTNSEHIQVTIRNLTLDATAKNDNGYGLKLFDNAAVQSIRKSKVKCYDLKIVKSSGYPFYVNGKYDASGAYLYVENTVLGSNSGNLVDTATPYLVNYYGVNYANGEAYIKTSTYIKNIQMDPSDWEW